MEKIKVIYEDQDILVLDKPAGMTVSTEGVRRGETVEDWVAAAYPGSKELKRHGIVHRLDKGTSGLMVVAKSEKALEGLQQAFKNREVSKTYWALVGGDVPRMGEINAPIGRSAAFFGKWRVKPGGKAAQSFFRVIGHYNYSGKKYSLVEVAPKTGRTHQIRVHFTYLSWPLVGDRVYGGEVLAGLERPFLHAVKLAFTHPTLRRLMEFESQPASDLQQLLNTIDEKR